MQSSTQNGPAMREEFLPFSRPSITDADIAAVVTVLRSGWITTGPCAAEFEKRFAAYVGCPSAVALTSATAGMHVLIKALDIQAGDEVITPSMTWVSTANLITLAGAKPVFVDVDRHTLMTSADRIAPLISPRTKLVIPVHFAGAAVDMQPIRSLCLRHGVFLAEDAAHAAGTACRGERVGLTGTCLFSFHPIKNITTGEGGMFCTNDSTLADRVRRLKFHGLGVDAFDRQTHGRSPQAEVLEPGYKYNLPDIAAALGISQLSRLDAMNRQRAALAQYYREQLSEIPEIIPLADPAYPVTHAWHLFIVRLDTDRARMDRDTFMQEMKNRNIGTGLHFKAIHLQKFYKESMGCRRGLLPDTEWNSDRICSLPLFPDMTQNDVDDVASAIKDVLASARRKHP